MNEAIWIYPTNTEQAKSLSSEMEIPIEIARILVNRNITDYTIIALSNDYPTINEVSFLLKQNNLSKAFIPVSSKNLFFDISADSSSLIEASRVKYYKESDFPEKLSNNEIFLGNQQIIFNFDSLNMSFFNANGIAENGYNMAKNKNSINIIIKAVIEKSDILTILSETVSPPQYLICQRLTKSAREKIAQNSLRIPTDIKIIETSQVGAVELLIKNGRLHRIKCGNYNIF